MSMSRVILVTLVVACALACVRADVQTLSDENFTEVTSSGTWMVGFHTPSCEVCEHLEAMLKGAASGMEGVQFALVDARANPATAELMEVETFPAIRVIVDGQVKSGGDNPPSDVVVLTGANFEEHVSEGTWLVEFYAPWCGHCQHLAPTWEKLATALEGKDGVHVGKVDATEHRELGERFDVAGFPTIKLFRDGGELVSDYDGGRDLGDFLSYVERMSGPAIVAVDAAGVEEALADATVAVVLLGGADEAFDAVARSRQGGSAGFFAAAGDAAAVAAKLGADDGAALVMVNGGEVESFAADAWGSADELETLVAVNSVPFYPELGPQNYGQLVDSGLPLVMSLIDPERAEEAADYKEVHRTLARANRGKFVFAWLDVQLWGDYVLQQYHLTADAVPTFIVVNEHEQTWWMGVEDASEIQAFLDGVLDGSIEPSTDDSDDDDVEAPPAPDSMFDVDEDSFDATVAEGKWIVLFTMPDCAECDIVEDALAHSATATVNVAKVDAVASPTLASRYDVKTFPTVVYLNDGTQVRDTPPSNVVVLTDDNFDDVTSEGGLDWFVEFYAPWCGHCQQLAPTWDQLGAMYAESDKVRIGKVDVTENEKLGERFGIQGFPTLKFIRGDTVLDYEGGRDFESLAAYVNKFGEPAIEEVALTRFKQLLEEGDPAISVLFISTGVAGSDDAFDTVANKLVGASGVAFVRGEKAGALAAVLEVEEGTTVAINNGDRFTTTATDVDALTAFVEENKTPFFPELGPENYGALVETGKPILLPMVNLSNGMSDEVEAYLAKFKAYAREHKDKLVAAYLDGVQWTVYIETVFAMSADDLPAWAVVDEMNQKHYLPSGDDAEDLAGYIEGVLAGDVEPFVHPDAEEAEEAASEGGAAPAAAAGATADDPIAAVRAQLVDNLEIALGAVFLFAFVVGFLARGGGESEVSKSTKKKKKQQ